MKLTPAERQWLADVQTVLDRCPSDRFGFYTIGDAQVTVYDRRQEAKINELMDTNQVSDFPIAVDRLKAEITELNFPQCVHSVAG
jgi:hypothetical protein